jgi:hypothetical protein
MSKPTKKVLDKAEPWYKFPMAWLVFALPLIAVIASLATVVIATKNAPLVLEHNESYKSVINNKKKNKDTSKD